MVPEVTFLRTPFFRWTPRRELCDFGKKSVASTVAKFKFEILFV